MGSTVFVFILACCACVFVPVYLWASMMQEEMGLANRRRDGAPVMDVGPPDFEEGVDAHEAQAAPLLGEAVFADGARLRKADGTPVFDDPPPQLVDPHAFMGALVGQHA